MGNRADGLQDAFAAEMRAEMAALNISDSDMAERIGVSHQSVGRYKRGLRDIPFPTMVDIAEALGLDLREMLARAYSRIGVDTNGNGSGK